MVVSLQASHLETKRLVDELMLSCYSLPSAGVLFMLNSTTARCQKSERSESENDEEVDQNRAMPVTNQIEVSVRGLPGRRVAFPQHNSLGIFSPLNQFRVWCAYIVRNPYFDNFILLSILVTTMTLVFVEYPDDKYIADQCPHPDFPLGGSAVLDCSGWAIPGQIGNINCPRDKEDAMFGKVYPACGQADEPACCGKLRQVRLCVCVCV